jgi:hypothetical protein
MASLSLDRDKCFECLCGSSHDGQCTVAEAPGDPINLVPERWAMPDYKLRIPALSRPLQTPIYI